MNEIGQKMKLPMFRAIWVLAFLAFAGAVPAVAQDSRNSDKESDGQFTGIALITDDLDWHEVFFKPETPNISGRSGFGAGEWGAVALIFSNASSKHGKTRLECSVTGVGVDGEKRIFDPFVCYDGPSGQPNVLLPTGLDLRFQISDEDPVGEVGLEIHLRDLYSDRAVDLEVWFMQGESR